MNKFFKDHCPSMKNCKKIQILHHHYFLWDIPLCVILMVVCRWQTRLDRVGIVTGVTGNLCLTFLFYPVTRGSSILPMLGLTMESSIKYHIWLGHLAMSLFTIHGFIYILYWIVTNRLSEVTSSIQSRFLIYNIRVQIFLCYLVGRCLTLHMVQFSKIVLDNS